LDFSIVSQVDVTACTILRNLARSLAIRGIRLALAELYDEVAESLIAAGANDELPRIASHRSVEDCLAPPTEPPGSAGMP
jgi:hypothetical protein